MCVDSRPRPQITLSNPQDRDTAMGCGVGTRYFPTDSGGSSIGVGSPMQDSRKYWIMSMSLNTILIALSRLSNTSELTR